MAGGIAQQREGKPDRFRRLIGIEHRWQFAFRPEKERRHGDHSSHAAPSRSGWQGSLQANPFQADAALLGQLAQSRMHQIFIFATLGVILLLQFFFLTKTRFGILMQATAQDLHTARLVGIPVNRTIAVAFAFGAVLSGIAGLLVAPIFLAEPTMGGSLGLKGFVVSVIGGFGNLPGAVIGGLFLGLIETFGARYISSNFRDAYAFIVMIAVLVAWPRGLFGEKSSEKV